MAPAPIVADPDVPDNALLIRSVVLGAAQIPITALPLRFCWKVGSKDSRIQVQRCGALEKAGIEFIAENGGGPGVRLRKV